MRKRWSAVVVLIALLSASAWWFSAAPEPVRESELPPPELPTAIAVVDAPVDAPIPVDTLTDAGAVITDAGVEAEAEPRPLVSTYYLSKGNTVPDFPRSKNEFQLACAREAQVCLRRLQRSGFVEVPILLTIGGEPGARRVIGYSQHMEIMGGPTPFSDCVLSGLSTHTFVDPTMTGDQYSCSPVDFRDAHDVESELARAAAKCVGPDSKAEVVTITRIKRRGINEPPAIGALRRLDLSTESCLLQAALASPLPPDSPSRTLQLVLADGFGGHIPEEDRDRLSVTERRTTPRVIPTAEALAEAIENRKLAAAASGAGNAKEAVRLLRACLTVDPDNVECLRASTFAWMEYLRQNPGMTSVAAATIWVRFATEMPPDDPDLPSVNAALARMGVHLR